MTFKFTVHVALVDKSTLLVCVVAGFVIAVVVVVVV